MRTSLIIGIVALILFALMLLYGLFYQGGDINAPSDSVVEETTSVGGGIPQEPGQGQEETQPTPQSEEQGEGYQETTLIETGGIKLEP